MPYATKIVSFLLIAACLSISTPRAAAEDPSTLPAGRQVVERYIEVTGGRAMQEKIKSRVSKSRLELVSQGIQGNLTIYQLAPDKGYIETDIQNVGRIRQGFDGTTAWESSALTGPRIIQGAERDTLIRSLTLGSELYPEKYFKSIETVAIEEIDGKPVYKVELTPNAGAKEVRYYDKESGLLVRIVSRQQSQMGEVEVISTPTEYKEMAGVKMPTKLTQGMMGQTVTLTMESVEHDVEIPADKFELPAEIKALAQRAPTTKPK